MHEHVFLSGFVQETSWPAHPGDRRGALSRGQWELCRARREALVRAASQRRYGSITAFGFDEALGTSGGAVIDVACGSWFTKTREWVETRKMNVRSESSFDQRQAEEVMPQIAAVLYSNSLSFDEWKATYSPYRHASFIVLMDMYMISVSCEKGGMFWGWSPTSSDSARRGASGASSACSNPSASSPINIEVVPRPP